MKRKSILMLFLLVFFSSLPLVAVPEYDGKLAGTETAYIDTNIATIGIMDSTVNFLGMVSLKSNILFDALGLYNIGIKVGYHFRKFMDIRFALGYTWFSLNEDQFVTGAADSAAADSGITINSLNLNMSGQKMYMAIMMPLFGFTVNGNIGLYSAAETSSFFKVTGGVEKTFFHNHLALFANGGVYIDLPDSMASAAAQSIYYNTLVSDVYFDGGIRVYAGNHFKFDLGVIYPGMDVPLGTDSDTGEDQELNLPVLPVFNIAYRF